MKERKPLRSEMGWSTTETITVRGYDLPSQLLGKIDLGGMAWLEIDTWDPASLALIRRQAPCPIASCETLHGRREFKPFFENRSMDVAIVDVVWNGLYESLKIAAMAALLEFEDLLDRRTDGFSTGERLKVALARALVHDPQHVILDEPTNGLDVVATRALRRLLLRLRDAGKCIVFSSHVMQEVDLLSDRIYVIAHGRTVADGSVSELLAQADAPTLEDAFIALAFGASTQAAPGAQP